MAPKEKLLKNKDKVTQGELAELLEIIANRIRRGELTLGGGKDSVKMVLPERFQVEIAITDTAKKQPQRTLEIELKWLIDELGNPVNMPERPRGFFVS
ncbi:MAG: amphi-Trp domain-containing protein [Trueperella sp.]|nr:amphi-Trp domain-containing protein [Trueperella sp.]